MLQGDAQSHELENGNDSTLQFYLSEGTHFRGMLVNGFSGCRPTNHYLTRGSLASQSLFNAWNTRQPAAGVQIWGLAPVSRCCIS
jgi:hypothetical protein